MRTAALHAPVPWLVSLALRGWRVDQPTQLPQPVCSDASWFLRRRFSTVETPLATNLALDQELLDRAFRVSGEPTKKAAVTRALQEFIARHALLGADQVFTAGLVLQELLQGFDGPKDRAQLVERLSALGFLQSVKGDHLEAAEVRNSCRRRGVPIGTMDALLIQLCRGNDLTLLTTDQDFHAAARHVAFSLWGAS